MRYYHDARARVVYAVPDAPDVLPKYSKGKRRRYEGCVVSVVWDVTSADNYIDPKTHQWAKPVRPVYHQNFDDRDLPDRAVGFFRPLHMVPPGVEITAAEYERIRSEYEAEARANTPPP